MSRCYYFIQQNNQMLLKCKLLNIPKPPDHKTTFVYFAVQKFRQSCIIKTHYISSDNWKKKTKQNKRGDKVSFIKFIWTIMVLLICWSALCSNWSCTETQGNNACLTKGCWAWCRLSVHYSCPYSGFPRLHFHNFSSLQLESFRI